MGCRRKRRAGECGGFAHSGGSLAASKPVGKRDSGLLRLWWISTLLLAALGLVMGGAHLLELPVRTQYDPEFYMRTTSTLSRYFALIGGPVQLLAFLLASGLAWLTRGRVAFRATLLGTLAFALSLVLWFLLVQPVNAAWAEALRAGPGQAVQAFSDLSSRWEGGHVVAFLAWLAGFILLLYGTIREIPGSSRPV